MSGIAVGLGKGHVTSKVENPTRGRAAYRKGITANLDSDVYRCAPPTKRIKFIREIVLETSGFAPYEKRIMEILKIGKQKRALRFAKKRLGTHTRGMKKRATMSDALRKR